MQFGICPKSSSTIGLQEYAYEAGAWFGEACLFQQNCIRDFTAFAAMESELAVLALRDYQRVLRKDPPQASGHKNIEREIQTKRLTMTAIAYKMPTNVQSKRFLRWQTYN